MILSHIPCIICTLHWLCNRFILLLVVTKIMLTVLAQQFKIIIKLILIEENLAVREARFDTFLKGINNIYSLTCCDKYERNRGILKHIEDFV